MNMTSNDITTLTLKNAKPTAFTPLSEQCQESLATTKKNPRIGIDRHAQYAGDRPP